MSKEKMIVPPGGSKPVRVGPGVITSPHEAGTPRVGRRGPVEPEPVKTPRPKTKPGPAPKKKKPVATKKKAPAKRKAAPKKKAK